MQSRIGNPTETEPPAKIPSNMRRRVSIFTLEFMSWSSHPVGLNLPRSDSGLRRSAIRQIAQRDLTQQRQNVVLARGEALQNLLPARIVLGRRITGFKLKGALRDAARER